jgi:hypothetical protein
MPVADGATIQNQAPPIAHLEQTCSAAAGFAGRTLVVLGGRMRWRALTESNLLTTSTGVGLGFFHVRRGPAGVEPPLGAPSSTRLSTR